MSVNEMRRGEFLKCAAGAAAAGLCPALHAEEDAMAIWQRETDMVSADVYKSYLDDGDTRSLVSLEKLEAAYKKVVREMDETEVGDIPAVWSVYNMGYVVKTRNSTFSIDLVHRRDAELASKMDFALITHNHADHWREGFYRAMNGSGKTVVSNFLDNSGAADKRRPGSSLKENGGYTRARRTFLIKDVEIRTSLVDHNEYLVDFTTAFEIRVGDWLLYHTGDCGKGSEEKLGTTWGRPDLWLFFPGCKINVAEAIRNVQPKRVVFGHLWELSHATGRLTEPRIRRALSDAKPICEQTAVALWGDRVS